MMDRRVFGRFGLGLFAGLATTAANADAGKADAAKADAGKPHAVAIQVSSEDRKAQGLALGNAHNYAAYYKGKGEPFSIEIVVFGPGFSMVRGDISMMKGEVENLQQALGAALRISACANTRAAIAESEGKKPADVPLLPGITEVPSGIVRLAQLQEQGTAYVRP